MSKRLSPAVVLALKDALCAAYWYKNDLRGFLRQCLSNSAVLATLNWDNYKRQIVSDLIDYLIKSPDKYLGDIERLCYETCNITSFAHLEQLDDGAKKAERARKAIAHLKTLVQPHELAEKEKEECSQRQKKAADKLRTNMAMRQKLGEIRARFAALVRSPDVQGRGFELEKLMYEVFELFDLDPKASFRKTGEQLDGAFTLEGTDYLFEARWQQDPVDAAALDAFASKVRRKLENTLGVFLSINGFSCEGVAAHSSGSAVVILMDGTDLMAVFEERIDLVSLLIRKKRHAAQTGNIYLRFQDFNS
jgi:hypothetical protein